VGEGLTLKEAGHAGSKGRRRSGRGNVSATRSEVRQSDTGTGLKKAMKGKHLKKGGNSKVPSRVKGLKVTMAGKRVY